MDQNEEGYNEMYNEDDGQYEDYDGEYDAQEGDWQRHTYQEQTYDTEDDASADGVVKLQTLSRPGMLKICDNFNSLLKTAKRQDPKSARILLSTSKGQKSNHSLISQALKNVAHIPSSPPRKLVEKARITQEHTAVRACPSKVVKEAKKLPETVKPVHKVRHAASFSKLINESFIDLGSPPPSPDPPKMYTQKEVDNLLDKPRFYTQQEVDGMLAARKKHQEEQENKIIQEPMRYTLVDIKKLGDDMDKDMFPTSTPNKSVSPVPRHIPTGNSPVLSSSNPIQNMSGNNNVLLQISNKPKKSNPLPKEEPTRVSPRLKGNAPGEIKTDRILSTSRKSLFSQEKSVVLEDNSLESIPPTSPFSKSLNRSLKSAIVQSELNTETRRLIEGNAAVIQEGQQRITDSLIATQKNMVDSTRKMAESVSAAFKKQSDEISVAMTDSFKRHATDISDTVCKAFREYNEQMLQSQQESAASHAETMEAVTTVEEKLVEVILKKEIKLVSGLDRLTDSVISSATCIAKAQKEMLTGVTSMATGIALVSENMAQLLTNHAALMKAQEASIQMTMKADKAVETLVKNLDILSDAQVRINHSHLAKAVEHSELTILLPIMKILVDTDRHRKEN